MGHVLSSDTVYAVAYLTEKGRQYLFDPSGSNRFKTTQSQTNQPSTIIDSFKIAYFSLSDPDYNYAVDTSKPFETGDISNVSGKNDDCIKGTVLSKEVNLVSVNGSISGGGPGVAIGTITSPNITDVTQGTYQLETQSAFVNCAVKNGIVTVDLDQMPTIIE